MGKKNKDAKNGKKGQSNKNQNKKEKRIKNQPQSMNKKKGGYLSTCPHFKFINEEKVRSIFNDKYFMKAMSSNKPLSSQERKTLEKKYKNVNWHKLGNIHICLVCGQPFDDRYIDEHMKNNKNHCLALCLNDRRILCLHCDETFPIEPHTFLATLLGADEEEDPSQKLKALAVADGSVGARGLHNLGNSCWMNASLQLLARLELVPETVPSTCPLSQSFANLAAELKKGGHPIKPGDFVSKMLEKLPFLTVVDQQDAYEFLVLFLDSMRDELGGSPANLSSHDLSLCRTSLSTPIDQCVGFILKSSMKCENCESYHYLYQRTTILSICVPIGQPSSLEECLKMYFSESASAGDDWRCDNCGQVSECTLTPSFAVLPNVLIIHLARFRMSNYGFVKNNIRISIPDSIDTTTFGAPGEFTLLGFITHHGTMEGGHYTSVYQEKSGRFLYFDDNIVSTISKQEALNIQPYILFYVRK